MLTESYILYISYLTYTISVYILHIFLIELHIKKMDETEEYKKCYKLQQTLVELGNLIWDNSWSWTVIKQDVGKFLYIDIPI